MLTRSTCDPKTERKRRLLRPVLRTARTLKEYEQALWPNW